MALRKVTRIFLHTSDSAFGDAETIRKWHTAPVAEKGRGWSDIGYHFVVLNGRRASADKFVAADDGALELGRPVDEAGSHVEGANFDSIGICLVGKHGLYTVAQIHRAVSLVRELVNDHGLSWASVFGHYQAESGKAQGKTCPDFSIDHFRSLLRTGG